MSKIKEFVVNNIASWIIEISILGIIASVTISEVRKTNEQTREMLSAISTFAADRQEGVADAIDAFTDEAQNVEIEGAINLDKIGSSVRDYLIREEDTEED